MDSNYEDIFWDLFKRFGGIDAYICYSACKKDKKITNCTKSGYIYEHV